MKSLAPSAHPCESPQVHLSTRQINHTAATSLVNRFGQWIVAKGIA